MNSGSIFKNKEDLWKSSKQVKHRIKYGEIWEQRDIRKTFKQNKKNSSSIEWSVPDMKMKWSNSTSNKLKRNKYSRLFSKHYVSIALVLIHACFRRANKLYLTLVHRNNIKKINIKLYQIILYKSHTHEVFMRHLSIVSKKKKKKNAGIRANRSFWELYGVISY